MNNSTNGVVNIEPMVQAVIFSVLTFFGVIGNTSVIFVIIRVFITSKIRALVYVYVLFLSIIDLAFLLSSTLMISFYYRMAFNKDWPFGLPLCKLMYVGESLNKCLSVYMLVVLSADRYRAICRPLEAETRLLKTGVKLVIVVTALVISTNIPFYLFATVSSRKPYPNASVTFRVCEQEFPTTSFSDPPWNNGLTFFALAWVGLYFVLPACLIVVFYVLLILYLKHQERNKTVRRRLVKRGRVTRSILMVVVFYFVCWTPYWINIVIAVLQYQGDQWFRFLGFSMPYVNAGINPFLYGMLNKSLRRAYKDSVQRERSRRIRRNSMRDFNKKMEKNASPTIDHQQRIIDVKNELRRRAMLRRSSRRVSVAGDVAGLLLAGIVEQSRTLMGVRDADLARNSLGTTSRKRVTYGSRKGHCSLAVTINSSASCNSELRELDSGYFDDQGTIALLGPSIPDWLPEGRETFL